MHWLMINSIVCSLYLIYHMRSLSSTNARLANTESPSSPSHAEEFIIISDSLDKEGINLIYFP